eukprot:TRINITY_DN90716_c0_g1_i1.p1 TRINITY_DN90716_c0_g1~~TRINITY_DN90716_c0_g1_i1.p1  ORF type:complete len:132 (+),score=39.53 TRINITY_DN90716_c0_g1_i1:76-471(+)
MAPNGEQELQAPISTAKELSVTNAEREALRSERIAAKEQAGKESMLAHLARSKEEVQRRAEEREKRITAERAARKEAKLAARQADAERAKKNKELEERRQEKILARERLRREKELAHIRDIKAAPSILSAR